jgi:hypothetical protein
MSVLLIRHQPGVFKITPAERSSGGSFQVNSALSHPRLIFGSPNSGVSRALSQAASPLAQSRVSSGQISVLL